MPPTSSPELRIRAAHAGDLPAILAIYNDVIANSTAVYSLEPSTLQERSSWLAARTANGFPVLIGELGGEVAGFASCAWGTCRRSDASSAAGWIWF